LFTHENPGAQASSIDEHWPLTQVLFPPPPGLQTLPAPHWPAPVQGSQAWLAWLQYPVAAQSELARQLPTQRLFTHTPFEAAQSWLGSVPVPWQLPGLHRLPTQSWPPPHWASVVQLVQEKLAQTWPVEQSGLEMQLPTWQRPDKSQTRPIPQVVPKAALAGVQGLQVQAVSEVG
jgi:hypothetical protein